MIREVAVVVRRGEEFLVARRSPAKGGYWHLVAGGVEPGEEWHAAAVRELREETGLEVEELAPVQGYAYLREDWEHAPGERVFVQTFLVDAPSGWEPTLNDEHDEYRWCSRDEAVATLFWPEPRELLTVLA